MSLAFKNRKSKFFDFVYRCSPAFVHNVIYSAYGYLKLREAKRLYHTHVGAVEAAGMMSIDAIKAMQVDRIKSLLVYASEHSNYYRDLITLVDLDADADLFLEQFKSLPVLNKKDIIANFVDIKSVNADCYDAVTHSSGGTTGTTLSFLLDKRCYLEREAEVLAYWKRHGYIVGKEKTVMFRAGVLVPAGATIVRPWRHDYSRKMLYLSSYYASPEFYQQYYDLLCRWRPSFMHALPSAAYLFAKYLLGKGYVIPLKMFFSASEKLYPYQKEVIERAFSCSVVDHYGHCEPGNYAAGQCALGRYHIAPGNVYTEVTEDGDILETSLNNRSMPFIRYRVGDKADGIHYEPCGCGLNSPYLGRIDGRDSEVIHTGDGRVISSIGFDQIFRGNDVELGQIIQRKAGSLVVKLVVMPSFNDDSKKKLITSLQDRVGLDTRIEVHLVAAIPVSASGKYRMVISEIK